uniref:BPTI/Kunitz inhibitor domain-containing protein n=1 Tax=Maylandia zebra TaxID=106582 RepID=A0A3P9CKM1_9CICH
ATCGSLVLILRLHVVWKKMTSICFLGKDAGDCVNYTVRWFFDHKRSVCSRFWYSGCGGNENRFATQAECERTFSGAQPTD